MGGVLFGALGGACAAVLVVWALGSHPGRTDEALDAIREDVAAESLRRASELDALAVRVAALESADRGAVTDPAARAALSELAADVMLLRESLRMELMVVDTELERLAEIIDEVAGGLGGPDPGGPLSDEDEPRWVVLSADPEPGVRFSALARLGRARTDRSVQASLSRLGDANEAVVWQALRNLGGFRERGAAPAIAALLDHAAPVVRGAALDALLRLGAPDDTGFDPVAPAEEREASAALLRAWAEE